LLNEEVNSLYRVLDKYVPSSVISKKNGARTWLYGYDEKYDMVIISKTGQIGDIISIEGLTIALPLLPKDIIKRSDKQVLMLVILTIEKQTEYSLFFGKLVRQTLDVLV